MSLTTTLRATIREHRLLEHGDTVVVGVSGGPDSLSLLHALRASAQEFEWRLVVAHFNHQLRGEESDADEAFVVQLAREWGLPVANARWDVGAYAEENQQSIEQAARNLRYRFLLGAARQMRANAVAVAHNADDQVETILLHFLRGAGLSGLRGMAYKTMLLMKAERQTTNDQGLATEEAASIPGRSSAQGVWLIRPLLDVTRKEIEAYCLEHQLQPRVDETNFDTTILRNRLRHNVIPYLETINPNFGEVIRHTALSLSDDYDYIQQNVLGIFDRMSHPAENAIVFDLKWFRALPVNLQRGILREAVTRLRGLNNISFRHIENARAVAADKEAGAEASLPQGLLLVVGYDDFTIGEHLPLPDAPLLQGQTIALAVGEETFLPESDWGVRVFAVTPSPPTVPGGSGLPAEGRGNRWQAEFDADKIKGQLILRTRRPGDRFAPAGMGGRHKSLHEYMIDEKISRHPREFIPILADEEKILWVCGYRADERGLPKAATTRRVRVVFFKYSLEP